MTVESLRDIIIIIFGIVGTIGFITILVVMYSLYRRMSAIQHSITETLVQTQKIIAESKEAIKPIMQIVAIIDAVRSGVDLFSKISEMKKGGKQNEQGAVD